jgi:hypothetical protein
MGFQTAIIGILILVIILAVFIPITGALLPTMVGDMGVTLGMMVSSVVLVILASGIFVFMKQSLNRNADSQEGF